jgi:large subunit ribosomal protein L25
MSAISIDAKKRELGKKATNAVRSAGLIPGIFYAKGKEPIAIATTFKQLRPAVYTSDTHIITMNVEGAGKMDCIIKDVEFDPVTEEIVHFDLLGIIEGQTLHVEVPITLKGQAKGVVVAGGLLEHLLHKIQIECLPAALPENIEIDVTSLEVGKSIHVSDLKVAGVKFMIPPSTSIVAIHSKKGKAEDDVALAAPTPAKA